MHILGQISRITNPEDPRYEISLYLRISLLLFAKCGYFFFPFLFPFFFLPFQKRFLWVCWKRSLYVACTHRGKIVYIGISPHPAYAGINWELLLLYFWGECVLAATYLINRTPPSCSTKNHPMKFSSINIQVTVKYGSLGICVLHGFFQESGISLPPEAKSVCFWVTLLVRKDGKCVTWKPEKFL